MCPFRSSPSQNSTVWKHWHSIVTRSFTSPDPSLNFRSAWKGSSFTIINLRRNLKSHSKRMAFWFKSSSRTLWINSRRSSFPLVWSVQEESCWTLSSTQSITGYGERKESSWRKRPSLRAGRLNWEPWVLVRSVSRLRYALWLSDPSLKRLTESSCPSLRSTYSHFGKSNIHVNSSLAVSLELGESLRPLCSENWLKAKTNVVVKGVKRNRWCLPSHFGLCLSTFALWP